MSVVDPATPGPFADHAAPTCTSDSRTTARAHRAPADTLDLIGARP